MTHKLSWQTDDDVLREEARGEIGDRLVPIFTSDLGTSHCANGTTELSRHPGYYEAGRIAAAFVEGCPIEVLRKRRRDPRTLTPRSRAARYRRLKRQQAALDAMSKTMDRPLTPNASLTEALTDTRLRVKIARDAGLVTPAEARSIEADIRRRLRRR
jgi:hypothetical protein